MPKHHGKKVPKKGVGLKLVGSPDELIHQLISDDAERDRALDQITNEGPDHKQVHNALLLKRMFRLVQTVEKNTGLRFETQKGNRIRQSKEDKKNVIPVRFPLASAQSGDAEKIMEVLSQAPEHELTTFSLLLQSIEWSLKALEAEPESLN